MRLIALLAVVASCGVDDTISGHISRNLVWHLTELDGTPVQFEAWVAFPERGRVSGHVGCLGFAARQTAAYPSLAIGPITATGAACPRLAGEIAFLDGLRDVTRAEVQGRRLVLSDAGGDELVFRPVARP